MSFSMAVQVGGEKVSSRYLDLAETGLLESYLKNRGHFLDYTFNHVLWEYPFGAGSGRWGMMNNYFGRGSHISSLWAEIQLTGWLYDGVFQCCYFTGALYFPVLTQCTDCLCGKLISSSCDLQEVSAV